MRAVIIASILIATGCGDDPEKTVDAAGVEHVESDDEFKTRLRATFRQQLAADLAACDAAYLTICLDVLPGGLAPGVSAPAALGVPLAQVEALIDTVLASGRLIAADIAELNPAFDRDGLTARVAARIAARVARGWGEW